jgi:hypothetical protein
MEVMLRGYSKVDRRTVEVDSNDLKGDSGSGGGGGSGGKLLYAEAVITPAEFYNMNASPKVLVPAVPGKSIYLQTFSLVYNVGTPFTPTNPHLIDMPSGGALMYLACQLGSAGKAMMNGVSTAWVNLGAGSDGQPLALSFDAPFTAGAISEDALAVGWYFVY